MQNRSPRVGEPPLLPHRLRLLQRKGIHGIPNHIMLLTTTSSLEGKRIISYYGVVSGEAILGANIFKDFFAGIRDVIGGRSGSYEKELRKAKDIAMNEMKAAATELGANGIIGIDIDYETISLSNGGGMLMVAVSGTAVRFE